MKIKLTFLLSLFAYFTGNAQNIEQKANITNFLARKKALPEELIEKVRKVCKTTKTITNQEYLKILKQNSKGYRAEPIPNTYGGLWVTKYGSLYYLQDKQGQRLLKIFYQYKILTKETYHNLITSQRLKELNALDSFFEWILEQQ